MGYSNTKKGRDNITGPCYRPRRWENGKGYKNIREGFKEDEHKTSRTAKADKVTLTRLYVKKTVHSGFKYSGTYGIVLTTDLELTTGTFQWSSVRVINQIY